MTAGNAPVRRRPVPEAALGGRRTTQRTVGACRLLAIGGLLLASGCGIKTALTLTILTPPDKDPFASASTVTITMAGSEVMAQQSMGAVSSGKFTVSLELTTPPHDKYITVTIEGRDPSGQVVARGQTPLFRLPSSDTSVTVYVGQPGAVTTTAVKLPDDSGSQATAVGRKLLAGAVLRGQLQSPTAAPGLGALIVGGQTDAAKPAGHAWRYSPILHQLIDAGTPQVARYGAVLVASADATQADQALLWGGSDGSGSLLSPADKFDPAVSDLATLWATPAAGIADPGPPGAFAPTVTEVTSNVYLISGGDSASPGKSAQPQAQAVLVKYSPGPSPSANQQLGIARIAAAGRGPLVAPRSQHSASPVTLGDGSAALLFGGLALADRATLPVAELYRASQNSFQALPLLPTPPASRRSHVGLTLHSGKVLIAGGYQDDSATQKTVLGSALIIDPVSGTVTSRDPFLKTPRYAATITMLPQEVVICGGFDSSDVPLASCELFTNDDKLDPIGLPTAMPHARAGHLALLLETNQLLLVGGIGDQLKAVAELDIYTAR